MSKVVKVNPNRDLSHIVECNNKLYYVDSNYTLDKGYETMAFKYNGDPNNVRHKDIDWLGVHSQWHCSYEDMEKRHNYLIEHLEEVL